MSIVWFLLPMALALGGGFTWAFIRSVQTGQLDDVETPAHRILTEDP